MPKNIKSGTLTILAALYFTTVMNLSFWRFVWRQVEVSELNTFIFMLTLPVFIFTGLYLIFNLLLWPYTTKPVLASLLLISGAANYIMFQFGIYIDSDMIRNVFQTNTREAMDLVTTGGVIWVMFLGALPAVWVLFLKIEYQPIGRELLRRLAALVVCVLIVIGIAALSYKEYAAFGRNNRGVQRLINPTNYIYSTFRYFKKQSLLNRQFTRLDEEVRHVPYPDEKRTVLILIVGETARSVNFSLNGYERETNPKMKTKGVISFKDVTASGTATAVSVPAMFSGMTRKAFDADKAAYSENLMDLIENAGYQVLWRENDDGCKGVCTRVPTENMVELNNPKFCDGTYCYDEALLDGLEEYLKKIERDTVVVLHTMGSHGPTYFKRYPDAFKVFTPTCDTAEIQKCPREDIVNTYDNTILYTDYVIAGVIDILKKFPEYEAGLVYVSDHGESLGENNIYLHGLPYSLAPDEQIKVPLIMWFSEVMIKEDYLDADCLKREAESTPVAHDHLFHSLLGLLELKSKTYNPEYDLFKPCRVKPLP